MSVPEVKLSHFSIVEPAVRSLTTLRKSRSQWAIKPSDEEDVQQEELKTILNEAYERENHHPDSDDVCVQPSYSKFQVPYYIKCRNRYKANKKLYEQRFQYEIEHLIAQQTTGYEAARLNRHLCITTIWPPLHSRSEIDHTQRYFFSLSPKERKRLNWIISTNII